MTNPLTDHELTLLRLLVTHEQSTQDLRDPVRNASRIAGDQR